NVALTQDRSGYQVAPTAPPTLYRGSLRVRIKLPDRLAGQCIERSNPAVALGSNYLVASLDLRDQWAGPLGVQDVLARGMVRPEGPAGVLVEAQQAGGIWSRHSEIIGSRAIARDHVNASLERATDRAGQADAHAGGAGGNAQISAHVEFPNRPG